MVIQHYKDVKAMIPDEPSVKGVKMRRVIAEKEGAENFVMRVFEIEPGGNTPLHKHDWEHEVFILSGTGVVVDLSGEHEVKSGDVVFTLGSSRVAIFSRPYRTRGMKLSIPSDESLG